MGGKQRCCTLLQKEVKRTADKRKSKFKKKEEIIMLPDSGKGSKKGRGGKGGRSGKGIKKRKLKFIGNC